MSEIDKLIQRIPKLLFDAIDEQGEVSCFEIPAPTQEFHNVAIEGEIDLTLVAEKLREPITELVVLALKPQMQSLAKQIADGIIKEAHGRTSQS